MFPAEKKGGIDAVTKKKDNLHDTRPYKKISFPPPDNLIPPRGRTLGSAGTYDRGSLKTDRRFLCPFIGQAAFAAERSFMEFFNSAIDVLQTLVIALGAGLGIWGVINLLEGYGNDNPGAKSQGIKQLMAGGGVALYRHYPCTASFRSVRIRLRRVAYGEHTGSD